MSDSKPFMDKKSFLFLLLVLISTAVFITHLPALSSKALSFDDSGYFTENMLVQHPSLTSVKRFFTEVLKPSTIGGYYQPLTMISIMTDYALGGRAENLRQFRITSLTLHILNTCLIAILIYMLFERPFIAAIVALVFGLHPMAVEPICWIGERKTLLAAFFTLCSLVTYVHYINKKNLLIYFTSLALFIFALLSKPTATPLPLLLLLLDFWPLKRLAWKTVFEKMPFLAIAVVSAFVTYISQTRSAAIALPAQYGIARIPLFICHNIIFYLIKIFWPVNLSSHYPIPAQPWLAQPMIIAGLIGTFLLVSILIISLRWTRAPLTGWLFFFIAILPTMQIVQFSNVIASDKFAYLPSIGLLLILASFLRWLWAGKYVKPALISLIIVLIASMEAFATRNYLSCWRDSASLFKHMVALAPDASPLRNMLGIALMEQAHPDEAIENFNLALKKDPNDVDILLNLAKAYSDTGKTQEALDYCRKVLAIQPFNFKALDAFGQALMKEGKLDEAINFYRKAIKYNPDKASLHTNLGVALAKKGQNEEAINEFRIAERLFPASEVHNNLGVLLFSTGQFDEAIKNYAAAIRLDPKNAQAFFNMGNALLQKGEFEKAAAYYRKAIDLKPDYTNALINLAFVLAQNGNLEEAIECLQKAAEIEPENIQIHLNLAQALIGKNKFKEAAEQFSKVLQIDPNNPFAKEGLEKLTSREK